MQTLGLNHIVLTVGDMERSRAFYRDVLGFEVNDLPVIPEIPYGGFFFSAGGGVHIYCMKFQSNEGDRFSEFRIGLDHLSFTAPNREALDELAEKLLAAGVETKGVEQFAPTGNSYIAFRDPDNIQLEYWLP